MIANTSENTRQLVSRLHPVALPKRVPSVRLHPSADVSDLADIGAGTQIWNNCQIRERAHIGSGCILGKDVYVDSDVQIGDNVKIQNGVSVYHGTTIESDVFVGPRVVFTNDKRPRATTSNGKLKDADDWIVGSIRICYGASIGAGAILLPNVTVGRYAMVGAGALVTRDVADYALVLGSPARQIGHVCTCAVRLIEQVNGAATCPECGASYQFMGEKLDWYLETLHR